MLFWGLIDGGVPGEDAVFWRKRIVCLYISVISRVDQKLHVVANSIRTDITSL